MSAEEGPSVNEPEVHVATEVVAGSASDAAEAIEKRIEEPEKTDTKASIADISANNVKASMVDSPQNLHQRMIRNHDDDKAFALWSEIQQKMIFPEDIHNIPEIGVDNYGEKDQSYLLPDNRIILIAHDPGPRFVVPWRLCVKWEVCFSQDLVADDARANINLRN
ncbi:hypothetical protein IQ07DRAFT_408493 [Pyrenochaeta sp. DS3sAY3a]|nr:hypothetical protein IQ07DRAFT_408493 [Pyrenochaeta sp. DS3sAY3a]